MLGQQYFSVLEHSNLLEDWIEDGNVGNEGL